MSSSTVIMRRHSFLLLFLCNVFYLQLIDSRRITKMHADNPNIRHVPRGPPPPHPGRLNPNPPPPEKHLEPEVGDTLPDDVAELAYEKYLREVVRTLQNDPAFKAKMNNATREDVMTGKLADELEFAHHSVRTKLDEAKRREVDRLRADFRELSRLENKERAVHPEYIKTMTAHLSQPKDPKFAETFTKDDLQALIRKATADLDEIDERRRRQFKQHEMKRELDRRKQMEKLTPEERSQREREFNAQREKLKEHPKIHEPGHKKSLEDVWEEQDHLDRETFNPKTFFKLHDTNGDERLDELELEAMFQKEVEKMYSNAAKANYEADELEQLMSEERARMREHVMSQVDKDGDKSVSWREFLQFTDSSQFKEDKEWKGVPEEAQFSEEELQKYEEQLKKDFYELQRKKELLRKHKEQQKLQQQKSGKPSKGPDVTKPSPGGHAVPPPPPPDFYYDVAGVKIANYDARIEDYDDYSVAEFEN